MSAHARTSYGLLARRPVAVVALALAVCGCGPGATPTRAAPAIPPSARAAPESPPAGPPAPRASRASVLAATALPATIPEPLAGDPMRVTIHRLSNGLTVFVSPMPDETSIRAWVAVRAGSSNDPPSSTGLAHYLEHMLLFKGTPALGSLDWDAERAALERVAALYRELRAAASPATRADVSRRIDAANQEAARHASRGAVAALTEELGFKGDAFTDRDMTAYYQEIPANRLAQWARLMSELLQHPAFREFPAEIEAVYEERNMSDTAWERMWDETAAGLYPYHAYGTQTTIGTVEHLKSPAFDDMIAFYRRWYVPNNIAVVLVGGVDATRAVDTLEAELAGWEPRPVPAERRGEIEPLLARVQREVIAEGVETVRLAWHVPVAERDEAAWLLLDALANDDRVGLLYTELLSTQRVPRARAAYSTDEEASQFVLEADLAPGQSHAEVEGLLLDLAARMRSGRFDASAIPGLALGRRQRVLRAIESSDTRASWLARAFCLGRAWADEVAIMGELERVTADRLTRAAAHLGPGFVAVYRRTGAYTPPQVDKPTLTPVTVERAEPGAFARSVMAMPVEPLEPRWLSEGRDYVRVPATGGVVIAAPNGDTDLFELDYELPLAPADARVTCVALDALTLFGMAGRSALAVQRALFDLGSTVTGRCDRDRAHVTVEGVDHNLEATLALMRAWLGSPALPAEARRRFIDNELHDRAAASADKEVLGDAARELALYGDRSSYRDVLPDWKLRATSARALTARLSQLSRTRYVATYYGPRSADAIAVLAPLGKRYAGPVAAHSLARVAAESHQLLFAHAPGAADVRLWWAAPAVELHAGEDGVANVYAVFAHRYLWQEIRQGHALAYNVSTRFQLARDLGPGVYGTIATQADKLPETVALLLRLLASPTLEPTRFAGARARVIADYRSGRAAPRAVPGRVRWWARIGASEDPRPVELAAAESLTVSQLETFRRRAAAGPLRIVVVGDRARVDLTALGGVVPVTELPAAALFGYTPGTQP
jgi:predicted Zn-dependent peptidase